MSLAMAYVPRDSLIHKLDPRTKTLIVVFSIIPPVVYNFPLISFFVFAVSFMFAVVGKVAREYIRNLLLTAGWILIILFLIQSLFNPVGKTVLLEIAPGIAFKKEGVNLAIIIIARILAIFGSMYILTLTTHPTDLMVSIAKLGVPYKFVYATLSTLNIVPMLNARIQTIKEAQMSRGLKVEGNPLVRIKAFIPLITPLLLGSIIEAQERALALEARGFSAPVKKTFLRELKIEIRDKIVMVIYVMFIAFLLISPWIAFNIVSWLPF